jgi:predicted methyltransferase MtxX (methanogen marker protein 4)
LLENITAGHRVFMNPGGVRSVIFQSYGILCGIRSYFGAVICTFTVTIVDDISAY